MTDGLKSLRHAERENRRAEFNKLFESIPGRNIDRVRLTVEILGYKPNTIRIMRMKDTFRVIPERMLRIYREELARRLDKGLESSDGR